jgi:predicted enzyme involved in methoxymalonyl-ACP biosynthesis
MVEGGGVPDLHPVRIAVASSFTVTQLRPYLVVECARRGFLAKVYLAPFNQLEQELLDPNSGLYTFFPDLVMLATRLEELAPDLVHRAPTLAAEGDIGRCKQC